jgi:hypothetical protein
MSAARATTRPKPETIVRVGIILWSLVGLIALLTGVRSSPQWTLWGLVEVALFVGIIGLGVRKVRGYDDGLERRDQPTSSRPASSRLAERESVCGAGGA